MENSRRWIGRGSCPSSREKMKVSRSTNGSNVKRRWGPEPPLQCGGEGTIVWSSKEGKLVTTNEGAVLLPLRQRFSNFFQVGTIFISQNVLRTTLLLNVLSIC